MHGLHLVPAHGPLVEQEPGQAEAVSPAVRAAADGEHGAHQRVGTEEVLRLPPVRSQRGASGRLNAPLRRVGVHAGQSVVSQQRLHRPLRPLRLLQGAVVEDDGVHQAEPLVQLFGVRPVGHQSRDQLVAAQEAGQAEGGPAVVPTGPVRVLVHSVGPHQRRGLEASVLGVVLHHQVQEPRVSVAVPGVDVRPVLQEEGHVLQAGGDVSVEDRGVKQRETAGVGGVHQVLAHDGGCMTAEQLSQVEGSGLDGDVQRAVSATPPQVLSHGVVRIVLVVDTATSVSDPPDFRLLCEELRSLLQTGEEEVPVLLPCRDDHDVGQLLPGQLPGLLVKQSLDAPPVRLPQRSLQRAGRREGQRKKTTVGTFLRFLLLLLRR